MKNLLLACVFLLGCHSSSDYHDETAIVTNEIVVDFDNNVSESYITELGKKLSIHFSPESDYAADKIYIGEYYGDDEEGSVLDELNHNSSVEVADRSVIYSIPEHNLPAASEGLRADTITGPGTFPNDPYFSSQWGMQQIHLPKTWSSSVKDGGNNGNGVIVAVIDTGVSRTADMQDTSFVPGYNFVKNNDNASDDNSHGTHVAGTIAQSTNNSIGVVGVAYRASIMPIKVLSAEGSGSSAAIAQGIRWAADHGAAVINMSLGGPRYDSVTARAVKYAYEKGVVVVCASGNSAIGKVSYPAAYPGAIAVAATQKDEKVTFYSNWGKEIAVAAPGGNTRDGKEGGILQNTVKDGKDDYYYFMGTSMASPHVAGAAALIVGEGIDHKPDLVRQILTETARDPVGMKNKPKNYTQHYGAGIVDVSRAIERAKSISGATVRRVKFGIYAMLLLVLVVVVATKRRKK